VDLLFATSFGEAVQNPDPWQQIIGAALMVAAIWLKGKFPFLATILDMILPKPSPAPGPGPVDPPPVPVPDNLSLSDLVKLFIEMLKRQKQKDADEKAAIEAIKAELLK
jgi:hypothetical protein